MLILFIHFAFQFSLQLRGQMLLLIISFGETNQSFFPSLSATGYNKEQLTFCDLLGKNNAIMIFSCIN